jgi:hypothetical protein
MEFISKPDLTPAAVVAPVPPKEIGIVVRLIVPSVLLIPFPLTEMAAWALASVYPVLAVLAVIAVAWAPVIPVLAVLAVIAVA